MARTENSSLLSSLATCGRRTSYWHTSLYQNNRRRSCLCTPERWDIFFSDDEALILYAFLQSSLKTLLWIYCTSLPSKLLSKHWDRCLILQMFSIWKVSSHYITQQAGILWLRDRWKDLICTDRVHYAGHPVLCRRGRFEHSRVLLTFTCAYLDSAETAH